MLFNECTSSNLISWHQESTKVIVGSETNKNLNIPILTHFKERFQQFSGKNEEHHN